MVLDLFANRIEVGAGTQVQRTASAKCSGVRSATRHSVSGGRNRPGCDQGPAIDTDGAAGLKATTKNDFEFFTNCVHQVQRNLKASHSSPSALHTLASYYIKVTPLIADRPFCVSLSYATFLFHMQMARVSVSDVELYVELIATALSQLSDADRSKHPFVREVLRDRVLGLPSPTCRGSAHSVVLLFPQQYRAFAAMACGLLERDLVPMDIVYQFQSTLRGHCCALSPLVAHRALALLIQTGSQVRVDEQVAALQCVLRSKMRVMNLDFLLACYERLKRAVTDPVNGPSFGRALSIHCSELFLHFRSPIRREYVERFLYPSLCHPDMAEFLDIEATRQHLFGELLSMCTYGLSTANPFYMCLCALLQGKLDDEIKGAIEIVTFINSHMPYAAYFMSALAIDTRMSVSMFAKIVIALSRGVGLAMTGHEVHDEVATTINKNQVNIYNVIFLLREVVHTCSVTDSRRAMDMLKALRVAVPLKSVEALGKLSSEVFGGHCDVSIDPQLLCAEVAMVLHYEHIAEALESSLEYFNDVTAQCHYCGMQRSVSLLCPVNGAVHVVGQTSVSRLLSTLAGCAGSKVLVEKLIQYMHNAATQMNSAVHFLIYHIFLNAGQHRKALFAALEPYIRATLLTLVSVDRNRGHGGAVVSGRLSSEHKANVLMLHVKLVILFSSSIDPSYLESILKVFSELKLYSNHDALALWYMCNVLLRNCKESIELLPTDPQENSYCIDFPACAPSSATRADNAQMVIKLLDRAHSFSAETKKLVGCCVCRLIQDFNMQAPNIVTALLSSFGFVPIGLDSLSEFALPVGAGSSFWSFFLQQMKTSAPARTALMVALAKSMSRRFRITSPADAVSLCGAEPTGHLFSAMTYEAMKRNAPLARAVLFMISHWMGQPEHLPGKFVCLVYICAQLIAVVTGRGEGGLARVEVEAETGQDRMQFDSSVKKASKLLWGQQSRLAKLAIVVERENTAFFHLVRRLHRKVRDTIAIARGETILSLEAPEGENEPGAQRNLEEAGAMQEVSDAIPAAEVTASQPLIDSAANLNKLQSAVDDSVFNDFSDENVHCDGSEGEDSYATHYGDTPLSLSASTSGVPRGKPKEAGRSSSAPREAGPFPCHRLSTRSPPPAGFGSPPPPSVSTGNAKRKAAAPGADANFHPVTASPNLPTAQVAASTGPATGVTQHLEMDLQSHESQTLKQCDQHAAGHSARTTSPCHPHRSGMWSLFGGKALKHDKAVTVPFEKSFGTSPIQFDDSAVAVDAQPQEPSKWSAAPPEVNDDDSVSKWVEPALIDDGQGDVTPIEKLCMPQLQATTLDGSRNNVMLPSGPVLEYLRTHQAMDSLHNELQHLGHNSMTHQFSNSADSHQGQHSLGYAFAPMSDHRWHQITVEGCSNNYGKPHQSTSLVPGCTLVTPVNMVAATQVRRAGLPRGGGRASVHPIPPCAQDDANGVGSHGADGEGPVSAASEDPSVKRARAEHRPQHNSPSLQSSSGRYCGMDFFLQQNQDNRENVRSALQDLRYMQQQKNGVGFLTQEQQASATGYCHRASGAHLLGDGAENVPPSLPRCHAAVPTDLSPTTPFGQLAIPTQFVEQKDGTALRELRQAMGLRDPNDTRFSGKDMRTARGIGGAGNDSAGNGRSSGAWWTEMSSAPMPSYAADPQYSMELF